MSFTIKYLYITTNINAKVTLYVWYAFTPKSLNFDDKFHHTEIDPSLERVEGVEIREKRPSSVWSVITFSELFLEHHLICIFTRNSIKW